MMKSNQDQLDKFYEEIGKWDLHQDILKYKDEIQPKTQFSSADKYIQHQRQLLYGDLKLLIQKNAPKILPFIAKSQESERNAYTMFHCQIVKRFTVFEFNSVAQKQEQQQMFLNQKDYVLVFRQDQAQKIDGNHFLGVVDSAVENLVIVKTSFNDEFSERVSEREINVQQQFAEKSIWIIEKLCNLVNFNKTYLSSHSFQDTLLQDCIIDPQQAQALMKDTYILANPQQTVIQKQFGFDKQHMTALLSSLKKYGISVINGGYHTGKTTLAVALLKSFFQITANITAQREETKSQKKTKTYSIKELLENDSSDEESYKDSAKGISYFPWYQKGYKHIYDELDFTGQENATMMSVEYPTATQSDHLYVLKPKAVDEIEPPQRLLMISPNPSTVDHLLQMAEQFKAFSGKMMRLGLSSSNESINKKYSIEHLSGAMSKKQVGAVRDEAVDEAKELLLKQIQVLFITFSQVSVALLEKSLVKFDTVIIDDASLMNESDMIQVLVHKAVRVVLVGNKAMEQGMFLLNPKSDRTFFQRALQATPETIISIQAQIQAKGDSPQQKKGKKSAAKEELKSAVAHEISFVDVTNGEEQDQKESFVNENEAQSIIDYLNAFQDKLDLKDLAIMSPFRTQSLLIKNTIQNREDIDNKVKTFQEIGSFDEFVSRTFGTVIVSLCKTKNVVKQGGPLLNNPLNIDYLKSRATKAIIVFGKAKALNSLWKTEFYEKAKSSGTITEL